MNTPRPFFSPMQLTAYRLMDEVEFNSFSTTNLGEIKFLLQVSINRLGKHKSTVIPLAASICFPCYHSTRLFCDICVFGNKISDDACAPLAKWMVKTPHFC